jgi:hypothetical protein
MSALTDPLILFQDSRITIARETKKLVAFGIGLLGGAGPRQDGGAKPTPHRVPDVHAQAIERAVQNIFTESYLYAKQVESIAHAVIGVVNAPLVS